MFRNPLSLSKQRVGADGIIRDACVHAPNCIGTLQGNDTTASSVRTGVRRALYDRWKRNGPPKTVHDDRVAIERPIDDDGLPARPALPWLPIPSGLGHVVGESSGLSQVLRLLHDNSGRASGSRPGARISSLPAAVIGARPPELATTRQEPLLFQRAYQTRHRGLTGMRARIIEETSLRSVHENHFSQQKHSQRSKPCLANSSH